MARVPHPAFESRRSPSTPQGLPWAAIQAATGCSRTTIAKVAERAEYDRQRNNAALNCVLTSSALVAPPAERANRPRVEEPHRRGVFLWQLSRA